MSSDLLLQMWSWAGWWWSISVQVVTAHWLATVWPQSAVEAGRPVAVVIVQVLWLIDFVVVVVVVVVAAAAAVAVAVVAAGAAVVVAAAVVVVAVVVAEDIEAKVKKTSVIKNWPYQIQALISNDTCILFCGGNVSFAEQLPPPFSSPINGSSMDKGLIPDQQTRQYKG